MSSRPVHFEIPADNPERASKFFADVFGWEFNTWPGEKGYLMAKTGLTEPGIDGAIMKRRHPDQPLVNSIHVSSIDLFVDKISEAGGTIVVPKQTIPEVGHLAYFKDTEGNIHGLWEPDSTAA